jgi:hypothetical protein
VVELKSTFRQPPDVRILAPRTCCFSPKAWLYASLTFSFLFPLGCREKHSSEPLGPTEKSSAPAKAIPKETISHIPVGEFKAGSLPGQPGRDPSLEPIQARVSLGPFRIDAYPYPGEPGQPPRLGVTADEAQALCASRGGRLCTELEWERACSGPESSIYPTGNDPCAPDDPVCMGSFEVVQMTTIPEWTASKFGDDSDVAQKHVVRGAPEGTSPGERRCARRRPQSKDQAVGFRCCYGAPNAQAMKEPSLGPAYKAVEISEKELTELVLRDVRTAPLAKELALFKPEAAKTVLARGPGDSMGFTLTTHGVLWQPVRGSEFLVVTGKSAQRTAFVLVYSVAGDDKTLAGSFIMKNEPGPIALAYAQSIRPRMHFSGCFGCPGETGKVLFRPPEEVVLLQP